MSKLQTVLNEYHMPRIVDELNFWAMLCGTSDMPRSMLIPIIRSLWNVSAFAAIQYWYLRTQDSLFFNTDTKSSWIRYSWEWFSFFGVILDVKKSVVVVGKKLYKSQISREVKKLARRYTSVYDEVNDQLPACQLTKWLPSPVEYVPTYILSIMVVNNEFDARNVCSMQSWFTDTDYLVYHQMGGNRGIFSSVYPSASHYILYSHIFPNFSFSFGTINDLTFTQEGNAPRTLNANVANLYVSGAFIKKMIWAAEACWRVVEVISTHMTINIKRNGNIAKEVTSSQTTTHTTSDTTMTHSVLSIRLSCKFQLQDAVTSHVEDSPFSRVMLQTSIGRLEYEICK